MEECGARICFLVNWGLTLYVNAGILIKKFEGKGAAEMMMFNRVNQIALNARDIFAYFCGRLGTAQRR